MKLKYSITALILMITCFSAVVPARAGIPGTIIGNVKFRYIDTGVVVKATGQIVSKQGGHFEGNTYVKFEGSVSSRTDSEGRYIFSNDPEEKIVSTDATSAAKNYMYYLCSWLDTGATRCADRSIDQTYISCINSSCPLFTFTANNNPIAAGFNNNDTRFNDVCSNYIRSSNPPNIIGGNNIGNWCGGNCDGRINKTYLFVRHTTPPDGYRVKGQNYLVTRDGSEPIGSPTVLVDALNGPGVNPQDIIIDIEPIPIDGVCSSSINGSNQDDLLNTPSLCSTGSVANFITTATGWTWSCSSPNNGSTASCSAHKKATCGDAITTPPVIDPPTTNLCFFGTLIDPPGVTLNTTTNKYTWTCANATFNSVSCSVLHMTANPAMTILKDVKGGNVTDYLPADTATGPKPIIDASAQVQYRYTAENTGNVTLTNVVITDQLDTSNGHLTLSPFECAGRTMPAILAPGEKLICTAFATNGVLEGDIQNTATLNAIYNSTALPFVTNQAHYQSKKLACNTTCTTDAQCGVDETGTQLTCQGIIGAKKCFRPDTLSCALPAPAMTIKKYVNDVNASNAADTWKDANDPDTGPVIDVGAPIYYKHVITNTGNTVLREIWFDDYLATNYGYSDFVLTNCTITNGVLNPSYLISPNSIHYYRIAETLSVSGVITCRTQAINGVLTGNILNNGNAFVSDTDIDVYDPAYYTSRKLACQEACTQSAQCTTNYCSPTTSKCVNEAYPASADCQMAPTNALVTEKRIISAIDTLDGSRTISYMITVKNISITEDVENVQITDDMENSAATGPVSLIAGSVYGINLRGAQINTSFNGVSSKAMLAVSAGKTNLTLKKYPSSESYASVIYAVTYPLGTRSSASICDKAVVTGTNVISQFGSTSNDIKCIDVTATPAPSPTPPPPPPPVSPSPTAITPSVTIPPVTPTLTPTPAKIDLKLIKSVDKSKIKIGDRVEFTITIANESAVGALNVKVKDLLTSSFAYLSHETSYGQYDQAGGIWTIGNLNALATQTLKIKALVVTRDTLTNLAEVYQAEQPDSDSSPNNCDGGKNKEDDCADVTLTYDGVVAGITTKGGTLADTGNSLIAPLVFGVLGFGAFFIVLKLRSKHTLIIKVSNPGADSAARALLSRLLVHQTIAGGVVVASALLVGVSILNVANTVQLAQLKRASGGLDSSLTMVAAEVVAIEKSVSFDCGVASPTEVSLTKGELMSLKLTNANTESSAFIALPGYDMLTQSASISQQDASDDFIYEVKANGEKTIPFVPKISGTWYLTNASYCKKANKTNSFSIPNLVVTTDLPTPPPPEETVVHEAWYKMDEMTGTVAADSSGNGHSATLSSPNGPTWTAGHTGNGLLFDGIDDWVGVSTGTVPVTDLTYEAWVKTTDSDGAIMEAVASPVNPTTDTNDRNLCVTGGQLTHRIYDDETIGSTTLINDGSWHFVAATMSSSGAHKLYVDGLRVALGIKGISDVEDEVGYVIGQGPQCGPLTGTIDDVKIYNTARTAAQIYEDYAGPGAVEPSKITVTKASAAYTHTCAIQPSGKLICWGDYYDNPDGIPVDRIPEQVINATAVTTGDLHTCAIQSGGDLYCWGASNTEHQSSVPDAIAHGAESVASFWTHTCAIKTGGKLYCWGRYDYDQNRPADVPEDLANLTFTSVSTGASHTCAIQTGGQLHCWGDNGFHQTEIPEGLSNATAVTTGMYHTCAIKTGGKLYCWGRYDYDQNRSADVPEDLANLIFTGVAAGIDHTCAIQTGGQLHCWGDNSSRQTEVPEGVTNAVSVVGGQYHTCAIQSGGKLYCWGSNDYGQTTVPLESNTNKSQSSTPTLKNDNKIKINRRLKK